MSLLERLNTKPRAEINPLDFDQWLDYFSFDGIGYPFPMVNQTYAGGKQQEILPTFTGLGNALLSRNGIVWACVTTRNMLFSEATFQFRRKGSITSGDLYGTTALATLEEPWPGGTTRKMLAQMELHVQLAGNGYTFRDPLYPGTLRVLRPDWVTIVLGSRTDLPNFMVGDPSTEIIGYSYRPGGDKSRETIILPDQMAHFMPHPDPIFPFRGGSWLAPVIREIMADSGMTDHKLRFLENAAPQPLDAGVLTPGGWATMGDMQAGASVIGSDGKPKRVLGVFPQGERDIYRVRFSDGTVVESTDDHLWSVQAQYDVERGVSRTMSLREIMDGGLHFGTPEHRVAKWSIPCVEPIEYGKNPDLPVDPYVLGMLLGDGSFRGGGITLASSNEDADETEALVGAAVNGVTMRRQTRSDGTRWYFKGEGSPRPNPLTVAIRKLGLMDVIGHEKHIPDCYLTSPVESRLALLQGLVDSDGHVAAAQGCNVSITTTSEQMAVQILDLVGSLGALGTVSVIARGSDRLRYLVRIRRLPEGMIPCRLARKAARYRPARRVGRRRFIVGVDFVGVKEAQCIAVDSEDHLYVTDGYVLTHNTPNMVVTLDPRVNKDQFDQWVEKFDDGHKGVRNAYRTIYLAGGADATVVGADMKQLDFKTVQAHGEVRICNAAGIPPIVVGVSEGLDSATYSNYAQARRAWADSRLHPMWAGVCSELAKLVSVPGGSELWYDERRIAFLAEDLKDQASIMQTQAATLQSLIVAGWTPESSQSYLESGDLSKLTHTGLYSIQLQPPGTNMPPSQTGSAVPPVALACSLCAEPAATNAERCRPCAELDTDLRTRPMHVIRRVADQLCLSEADAAVALGLEQREPLPLKLNGKPHNFLEPVLNGNGRLR